jgi:hypothetical protein
VTSIFGDGRSFIPMTLFTPQFLDYDSNNLINITDSQNKPNIISDNIKNDSNNNQTLNNIYEQAFLEYQKLYKNDDDDNPKLAVSDDDSDFKKTFDQLAEKRLRTQAESEYKTFVAKREERIRSEEARLRKAEAYNQELLNKTIEAKINDANKKRRRRDYLKFFMGLLLGDAYDPSIPQPMLSILVNAHPGFLRLWRLTAYHIDAVSAVSRVVWGSSYGYYRNPPEISIKCRVKPRKQIIFAGLYRQWSHQFVRKIIEKRQRGPPLCISIKKTTDIIYIVSS